MDTRQTSIFEGFLIITVFVILIILFFLYLVMKQYIRFKKLESEKLHAEIKSSMAERKKIATELHNDIAPMLSVLMYQVEALEVISAVKKQETFTSVSNLSEQIRSLNKGLAPIQYYGLNVSDALTGYLASIKNHQLKITVDDESFPELNVETNEIIFRVLQEIILNTIKHAQAGQLKIVFLQENNTLLIKTADDGIGYNHQLALRNSSGYGLLSIISKIEHLGGVLYYDMSNGKGTRYVIELPLSEKLIKVT